MHDGEEEEVLNGRADDNDNGAIVMPIALPHCVCRVSFRMFYIRGNKHLEKIFVIPVLQGDSKFVVILTPPFSLAQVDRS